MNADYFGFPLINQCSSTHRLPFCANNKQSNLVKIEEGKMLQFLNKKPYKNLFIPIYPSICILAVSFRSAAFIKFMNMFCDILPFINPY